MFFVAFRISLNFAICHLGLESGIALQSRRWRTSFMRWDCIRKILTKEGRRKATTAKFKTGCFLSHTDVLSKHQTLQFSSQVTITKAKEDFLYAQKATDNFHCFLRSIEDNWQVSSIPSFPGKICKSIELMKVSIKLVDDDWYFKVYTLLRTELSSMYETKNLRPEHRLVRF